MYIRVEGALDAAVVRRIFNDLGLSETHLEVMGGRAPIHAKIKRYAEAAKYNDWFVLVDLDDDQCPSGLLTEWLGGPPQELCLRIAVRAIEAWVLADNEHLANFLGVSRARIPHQPEILDDPKAAIIGLATKSRSRRIREGLVPRSGSGRKQGPEYTAILSEFVADAWDVKAAAAASPSLARCIGALKARL